MPRQWIARGLAILWMFASVVFIASYTAQLTTTLTVEQIRGAIEGTGRFAWQTGRHGKLLCYG